MGTEPDAHADYVLLDDDSDAGSGLQEAASAPRRSARGAATLPAPDEANVRQLGARHGRWAATRQQALTRLAAAKRSRPADRLAWDSEGDDQCKHERSLAATSKLPRGKAQVLLSSSSEDDSAQQQQGAQPAAGARAGQLLPAANARSGNRGASMGQGAAAAAADDSSSDEQSPVVQQCRGRLPRAARPGRQAAQFLTGGRDAQSDTVSYAQSDSDADLADFIADEGFESGQQEQDGRKSRGTPGSSSPPSSRSELARSSGSEGLPAAAATATATGTNGAPRVAGMRPGRRRGSRGQRRVAARLVESSSEEDEIPEIPNAAAAPTPAANAFAIVGTALAATAAGRGGKVLIAGEPEQEPPRKRLRKSASGGIGTPRNAPQGQLGVLLDEPVGLEPDKASAQQVRSLPVRRARAAATAAAKVPAAERIRQAQQRWQQGQDDFSGRRASRGCDASSSDSDGSGAQGAETEREGSKGVVGGAPEHCATMGGASAPAAAAAEMATTQGMAAAAAGATPRRGKRSRHREASWQQAAAGVLGLGSYSEEELFRIYVEYQLLCLVDAGYAETVSSSPQHREYYSRAISRVEGELALKRQAVASAAWLSSARGLLEALENLPGIATDWANDDAGGESWDVTCAACNRRRSHATRLLILKGHPLDHTSATTPVMSGTPAHHRRQGPLPAAATPASHSRSRSLAQQLMLVSPTFRRRHNAPQAGVEGEEDSEGGGHTDRARGGREGDQGGRPSGTEGTGDAARDGAAEGPEEAAAPPDHPDSWRRAEFPVGRYCCARLTLYHALFHWRHRLLARLRRELKTELRRRKRQGQERERGVVADALLAKDSLLTDLHTNYRTLLQLSEKYQLSGGEGSAQGGWKSEFDGMHAEVTAALYALNSDSEGEESSVAWPDERDSDSGAESGPGSASTGSGSDVDLISQHPGGPPGPSQGRLQSFGVGTTAPVPRASRHGRQQSQQRQRQQRAGGSTGDAGADRLLSMLRAAAAKAPAPAPAGYASPPGGTEPPLATSQWDSPDAKKAWQAAQPHLRQQARPLADGWTATAPAGQLASAPQGLLTGRAVTGGAPAAGHQAGARAGHAGSHTNHTGRQTLLPAVRGAVSPAAAGAFGLRAAALNPNPQEPNKRQQQQQHRQLQGVPSNAAPSNAVPSPPRVQQPPPPQQQQVATTPRRLPPLGPAAAPTNGASSSKGSGLKQVGIRSFFGPSPPGSSANAALSPAELAVLGLSGGKPWHKGGMVKAVEAPSQDQTTGSRSSSAAQQLQLAEARVGWRPRGLGEALDRAAGA